MKYVVLFIVMVVAIGVWRGRRRGDAAPDEERRAPPRTPPESPQDIVACARCGMHIPRTEALMLGSKAYCCAEHRQEGPA